MTLQARRWSGTPAVPDFVRLNEASFDQIESG
jgi:hypothetical protein